jgi:acetyl-CoA carboxylase biotin carboxyl carrier protein
MGKKAKGNPAARERSTSERLSGALDLESLHQILTFMSEHSLEEFEYEASGVRIRLRKASRNSSPLAAAYHAAPEIISATNSAPASGEPVEAAPRGAAPAESSRSEDLHIIKSPIVGTFYAAPSPGAEPFVKVGDHVTAGQVLCIVEAMKLMNEIESDVAGEIARLYAESGQPVEYGESLFAIRPSRKM